MVAASKQDILCIYHTMELTLPTHAVLPRELQLIATSPSLYSFRPFNEAQNKHSYVMLC